LVGDSLTSSFVGRDRRRHRFVVAGGHLPRDDAEPRQVLRAELAAAVVTLVEKDHLVAGVQLGHQEADDRRHAAGIEQRVLAPFERRQLALDDLLARVAVAAVFLAVLLLLDEVDDRLRVGKRVGRGADDRVGFPSARLEVTHAAVHHQCRPWTGRPGHDPVRQPFCDAAEVDLPLHLIPGVAYAAERIDRLVRAFGKREKLLPIGRALFVRVVIVVIGQPDLLEVVS
jgi:hypothetical protein